VTRTIEPATPDDIDELGRLRHQLYDEYGEADLGPAEYAPIFADFARAALADPDWRAWVAREGGRLVASTWLRLVPRIPRPQAGDAVHPMGYLTSMYVEPEHRNGGLGSRMLGAVIAWAREEGVQLLICWPAPGDDAVRFYRRAGFTGDHTVMVLPLREGH
jgi:GNAT superfamily N-acetyltransferase